MTTAPADEPAPELLDRIRASLTEGHLREDRYLLARPGAFRAEMGAGRSMGEG